MRYNLHQHSPVVKERAPGDAFLQSLVVEVLGLLARMAQLDLVEGVIAAMGATVRLSAGAMDPVGGQAHVRVDGGGQFVGGPLMVVVVAVLRFGFFAPLDEGAEVVRSPVGLDGVELVLVLAVHDVLVHVDGADAYELLLAVRPVLTIHLNLVFLGMPVSLRYFQEVALLRIDRHRDHLVQLLLLVFYLLLQLVDPHQLLSNLLRLLRLARMVLTVLLALWTMCLPRIVGHHPPHLALGIQALLHLLLPVVPLKARLQLRIEYGHLAAVLRAAVDLSAASLPLLDLDLIEHLRTLQGVERLVQHLAVHLVDLGADHEHLGLVGAGTVLLRLTGLEGETFATTLAFVWSHLLLLLGLVGGDFLYLQIFH